MLYFLHQQTAEWKKQNVAAFISMAGCWGGAVKAIKVFLSGDNLGAFVVSQHTVRGEQRTSPSLAYLLPKTSLWGDTPLVTTVNRNYTAGDYPELFQDMGFPVGAEMWKDTKDLLDASKGPGVPVYCLYGRNVTTVEKVVFTKPSYFPDSPTLIYGDGDGTVNLKSLKLCSEWPETRLVQEFPNADHMSLLRDVRVLKTVTQIVSKYAR